MPFVVLPALELTTKDFAGGLVQYADFDELAGWVGPAAEEVGLWGVADLQIFDVDVLLLLGHQQFSPRLFVPGVDVNDDVANPFDLLEVEIQRIDMA